MYSCLNKSHGITSEVIRTKQSSNVHRAFTVHLAFLLSLRYLRVLHALAVHTHSTNSIQLSFTVRSLTMRSAFAQRSFSVPFTFILRSCVNIERFKDYYHFSTKQSATLHFKFTNILI